MADVMQHDVMDHQAWMAVADEEYRRLLAMLDQFCEQDWHRPTACTEWNVAQLVAHLIGAAEAGASLREMARQAWTARKQRLGAPRVDAMNDVQVHERSGLSPERLCADLGDAAERAVRRRRGVPPWVRAIPVPFGPPLGVRPIGYLMDCIYTRDAWMHRVDLAQATGHPLVLTVEHDGRLVADVVREWSDHHVQPYCLILTGVAGGRWTRGAGGEQIVLDAVEFCQAVSGRVPRHGLLAVPVPF